jgi:hypothetical protein
MVMEISTMRLGLRIGASRPAMRKTAILDQTPGTALASRRRMRSLAIVTACALAMAGCTAHRQMPRPLTPAAVAEVEEALTARGAWVEYGAPGQPSLVAAVQQGSFQHYNPGRPALILYTEEPAHAVPLEHVRELKVNNRLLGTLEGAGIGLLAGLLFGAVVTAGSGPPKCENGSDNCLNMDFRGVVMFLTTITGATTGTIVGAIAGHRYVYTF